MAELDTLEVKIQASATKAVNSVEKLAKKLDTLSTSIGKLDANGINKFASGMTNLANGMNAMKNVKLPDFTRTAKGLKQFENINTAKLRSIANTATPLANGLNAIANVQFNNSGLTNFVNALTRLSNSNISNLNVGVFGQVGNAIVGMSNQLQNAQQVSTNVIQLTNAIARLAGAGQNAVTVTNVLPAFGNVLRNLFAVMSQAPMVASETTVFTTALGNLAVAGNKVTATAAGLPALATALRSFFTTMSQAPTVSQNTIQMTQALAQLAAQGSRVGSATRNISSGMNSMGASAKSAKPHIKSLTSQLAGLYARVWVVIRAFSWFKKAIDISSDLTEVENVVVNTFGQYSSELEKFSKEAITNYGISELTAKETASRFQAMGIAMGAPVKQMASMSTELTKLSADLASFYNVDQSDAARSLWSVFTGETEPMRKFGLDLTEASLKAYALKNGLDGNISSMTQMEKTMLRYQYVMENTKNVQGDFARTSQNWANQLRILQEQIKAIAGVWGNAFVNMLKPLVQALNKALTAVYSFSEKVVNALGTIFGWKLEIQKATIDDDFGSAADDSSNLAGNTKKAAKAAKELKSHLLSIDELNVVEPDKDVDTGGTGGSGSGTGTGGAGSDNSLKFKVTETENAFKSSIKSLEQLGRSISNSLSKSMESINWTKIYSKASGFGRGLASFLNGLISPRLFGNVGKTIANSLNTALAFLDSFGTTFDWKNFGNSIASGINNFVKNFDFKKLAHTLNVWVDGLRTAIVTAIKGVSWSDVLEGALDFLTELDLDTVTVLIGAFAWMHGGKEIVANSLAGLLSKRIKLGIGSKTVSLSTTIGLSITTAIVGFKIGNWLYDHVPKIQEWSDALAKWLFDGKDKINITKAITVALTGLTVSIGTATLVGKLASKLATVATAAGTAEVTTAAATTAGGTMAGGILAAAVKKLAGATLVATGIGVNIATIEKPTISNTVVSTLSTAIGALLITGNPKIAIVAAVGSLGFKIGNKLYDGFDSVQSWADNFVQVIGNAITGQDIDMGTKDVGWADKLVETVGNAITGQNIDLNGDNKNGWSKKKFGKLDVDANVIIKTNGKKDADFKRFSATWNKASKKWQDKSADYDVITKLNGKNKATTPDILELSKANAKAWSDKTATYNVETKTNGNIDKDGKKIQDVNSRFNKAWQSVRAAYIVETVTNGKKAPDEKELTKVRNLYKKAWTSANASYNATTKTNGKNDADAKIMQTANKAFLSNWKGKNVNYDARTQVNGKNTTSASDMEKIMKSANQIWKSRNAQFNATTTVNGQKSTSGAPLKSVGNAYSKAWNGKTVSYTAMSAFNGRTTTGNELIKNTNAKFQSAFTGKTVSYTAASAFNGRNTVKNDSVKNVNTKFQSAWNGKTVQFDVKTQSNEQLQELGSNMATQIYAGMSQKEIGFKIKQQTQADGGTALDKLLKGSYSLNFQSYATGGFPEDGWFRASHGEYMGKFDNGQSVVANNEQITGGITMGVREAVRATLAPYLAEIAQNTRETADKDFTANIDGRSLVNEVDRRRTRNGYSFT